MNMCRYFAASTLKCAIYSSCFVVLIIGSVLVWIGFLLLSSAYVQVLNYSYTGYIVLSCGGILIFVAFTGIVGAWKTRRLYLTVFITSSILIASLLIAFGGVLIYMRTLSSQHLQDYSSCIQYFSDADETFVMASKVFCKLSCPCDLDKSTAEQLKINDFYAGSADNVEQCNPCESIQTYQPNVQSELIAWIKEALSINVTVTECAITSQVFSDNYFGTKHTKYLPFVTWMENSFQCSGLCGSQSLRFFTSVQPLPDQACYSKIRNWSLGVFLTYGLVSIFLGVYQYAILYFAFSLCLCPKRKIDLPPEALNSPSKAFKA